MKVLLLISGHNTTKLCRSLFNAVGRHKMFSMNDNVSRTQMEYLQLNWRLVVFPIVIITGPEELMDEFFEVMHPASPDPVFRLRLDEW